MLANIPQYFRANYCLTSNLQVIISIKCTFLVTYTKEKTLVSTADRIVVDLIRYTMPVYSDPTNVMEGFALEYCTVYEEAVEVAEIHKPPTFIIILTRTVFLHMSEQNVGGAHIGI